MDNIINLPKIKKSVRKRHKDFIDRVGSLPLKLSADQFLITARLMAKVNSILTILSEEKVIDEFQNCEDCGCKGYHLSKHGLNKSVFVWTDGKEIIFRESSLSIRHGSIEPRVEVMNVENIEKYDFEEFAEKLLTYIYETMYDRKNAISAKIFKD
jgi:hypothetical protein